MDSHVTFQGLCFPVFNHSMVIYETRVRNTDMPSNKSFATVVTVSRGNSVGIATTYGLD
jgi:hypothetical protein